MYGYYSSDSELLLQDAVQFVPDVIFIDLLMPRIPADEMIKEIKRVLF